MSSSAKPVQAVEDYRQVMRRISETEARQMMLDASLEPLEPYPGAAKPWRCKCLACGTEGSPSYANVRKRGRGCMPCGIAFRSKTRTLDDEVVVRLMKAAGVTPLEPYPGARKPWLCRCDTCGREVSPWYSSVQQGRGGCGYCGGHRLEPGAHEALMKASGLTPLVPYPGANKPWLCRCDTCGREVSPWYLSIQQDQSGCKFCSDHGFDQNAPAIVYLVQQPKLSAVKIGITGLNTQRMDEHRRQGWEVVATWDFEVGLRAEQVEGTVLSWWRDELKAPKALMTAEMPQRGETETAWLADVDIDETIAFIERLVAAD